MTRSRVFSSALMAAVLLSGAAGAVYSVAPAYADDKKPTIRPEMGKHLQPAQQLLKDKKPQQALAEIQQADAMDNKTPYEVYIIGALRRSAYAQLNDPGGVARAVESEIGSGQVPASEVLSDYELLFQLYYQSKDYGKAIDYGNRYYKEGGTDPKYHQYIAQAYYVQNDFTNASKMIRSTIQDDEKTGKKPTEDQLLMLLSSELKLNPGGPGYVDALQRLVLNYPKKDYWHDLIISVAKKPGMTDRLLLDIDQIRIATGVTDSAGDYMEAAQSALQAGFPGSAKGILDKGYAKGVLGTGPEAPRQKRLVDLTDRQAADDQKTLGQEASAAQTGTDFLKLGDAYAGYGQFDKAIEAYTKAGQKGSFKSPVDAALTKIHLGTALYQTGQKAKAKESLASVTSPDAAAGVAQLWLLLDGLK